MKTKNKKKKKPKVTKKTEEPKEEALDEFVEDATEAQIQAPDILTAQDITLSSGETLPQTLQLETLEESLEETPAGATDEENPEQVYETQIDDLYETDKEQEGDVNRVISTRALDTRTPAGEITLTPRHALPRAGMMQTEELRGVEAEGEDTEVYRIGEKKEEPEMPWGQKDERLKYNPRR